MDRGRERERERERQRKRWEEKIKKDEKESRIRKHTQTPPLILVPIFFKKKRMELKKVNCINNK